MLLLGLNGGRITEAGQDSTHLPSPRATGVTSDDIFSCSQAAMNETAAWGFILVIKRQAAPTFVSFPRI